MNNKKIFIANFTTISIVLLCLFFFTKACSNLNLGASNPGETTIAKKDTLPITTLRNILGNFDPNNIVFDSGSDVLKEEFKPDLLELAKRLNRPHLQHYGIQISGHTDDTGHPQKNYWLSKKRAKTLRNFLVKEGKLRKKRTEFIGHGADMPKTSNETLEGRAINRRVEFIFYVMDEEDL